MFCIFYKYSSKFFLCIVSCTTILSCVQKHKFASDKKMIADNKMKLILTDVFLMESYVSEKLPNVSLDSITTIKKSFYKNILLQHKVDSASFYITLNYYQSHPKEYGLLLNMVDSVLIKIKPLDTTKVPTKDIIPPKNIENLPSFTEQEKEMQNVFLKQHQDFQRLKNTKSEKQ